MLNQDIASLLLRIAAYDLIERKHTENKKEYFNRLITHYSNTISDLPSKLQDLFCNRTLYSRQFVIKECNFTRPSVAVHIDLRRLSSNDSYMYSNLKDYTYTVNTQYHYLLNADIITNTEGCIIDTLCAEMLSDPRIRYSLVFPNLNPKQWKDCN